MMVVCVIDFYSDDPSSNPTVFLLKYFKSIESKQKEATRGQSVWKECKWIRNEDLNKFFSIGPIDCRLRGREKFFSKIFLSMEKLPLSTQLHSHFFDCNGAVVEDDDDDGHGGAVVRRRPAQSKNLTIFQWNRGTRKLDESDNGI